MAALIIGALTLAGLRTVPPGRARVLTVLGSYAGTLDRPGFWCVNPLALGPRIDCRVVNHEMSTQKENDATGAPIEISAVVVSRVTAPAQAAFGVEDHGDFVTTQADAALRDVASRFPYEGDERNPGLRTARGQVAEELASLLRERSAVAGVEVIEVRLRHLAYATEIAQAMLRRQQADALIDARQRIVSAAVGMVDHAIKRLGDEGLELDEERKAQMINNLMVTIVSDQAAAPVLNTGTVY